jgi:hypothetical protein
MITLITIVAMATTVAWSLSQPYIYQASTSIVPPLDRLSQGAGLAGKLGGAGSMLLQGVLNEGDISGLYVGILKSRSVTEALIDRFDLMKVYENVKTRTHARKILGGNSRIKTSKEGIVHVTVEDLDPKRSSAMANAYVGELDRFVFMFIGEEAARKNIEEFALQNKVTSIVTLPYVPLEETPYSLSAADIHVISMGEDVVGVVHPCKIYGVMSTGRPFILFGPKNSHIGDILKISKIGWQINHGDIDGTVEALRSIEGMSHSELNEMGCLGREIVIREYSRKKQCTRFCEVFK